jgi:hypothetical protein
LEADRAVSPVGSPSPVPSPESSGGNALGDESVELLE